VQEAQESPGTAAQGPLGEPRSRLGTVVVALIALIGIVAGAIIFTRDTGAPDTPPTDNAGAPATLTDEEAIDRYLELEQLIVRVYQSRDLSLIALIYTPDSPTAAVARKELRDLRRDSIKLILDYDTEAIEVTSRSPSEVVLRQEVFARGRVRPVGDVKTRANYHDQRRVLRVTLRKHAGQWLIHRAVVVEAESITQ
jgi:hypothetical protein